MKRIVSKHRFAFSSVVVLALILAAGVVLKPRPAHAFTLININGMFFDPISIPKGQDLHIHLVNQLGTGPLNFRMSAKPTVAGSGITLTSVVFGLNPGEGMDFPLSFATFIPTTDRLPVVVTVLVTAPAGSTVPADFSARIASSLEMVDPSTNQPTAILAARHIVTAAGPCVFCQ